MFWIVALTAITPIAFLALIRYEPTARDGARRRRGGGGGRVSIATATATAGPAHA
jgi:hypothetical protein